MRDGLTELESTKAMLKRAHVEFVSDRVRAGATLITIATFIGTILMIFDVDGSLLHLEVKAG